MHSLSGRAKLLILACAASLIGAGAVVVASLGDDGASSAAHESPPEPTRFGKTVEPEELKAISRDNPYVPRTDDEGNVILHGVGPGRISNDPDPVLSSEVMSPVNNGWTVRNHYDIVTVQAGSSRSKQSTGMLAIWRSSTRDETGPVLNVVKVPGAGTLEITDAPLGRSVVEWAPSRGEIRFSGSAGVNGRLFLEDDSIQLDQAG